MKIKVVVAIESRKYCFCDELTGFVDTAVMIKYK